MFSQIGPLEIAIVLLVVLVIFGPKRLPGLGRSLGSGMREFKDAITGKKGDDEDDEDDAFGERRTTRDALPPSSAAEPAEERARESVPPSV
jgi:sec-independent protein translocase protein TatA